MNILHSTPYDITNATFLLINGVDIKNVSKYLGNNDIQTISNIYINVFKSQR